MKLALLAGILIGTSYIPSLPWALAFALVPLWSEWTRNPSAKRVFWTGWVTQFTLTLIGFHWIAYVAMEFGHLNWAVSGLVLLAYCSFASLHVPLSGLLWAKLNKRFQLKPLASVFVMALSYWIIETAMPMIFPWNLGYPLIWAGLPMYQTADIFGFEGLSLFVLLLNAVCFWLWTHRSSRETVITCVAVIALSLGGLNLLGVLRKNSLPEYDAQAKVLVIQGNIGNLDKAIAERGSQFREPIVNKYFTLTREALIKFPEAEIIFYPETAIPMELDRHLLSRMYPQRFMSFVRETGRTVLAGAYSQDPGSPSVYNGLFLWDKEANLLEQYRKTIRLAFGEYVPGAEYFPFLKKIVPEISDFKPGSGPLVMSAPLPSGTLKIGPLICYEGLHPWFLHDMVEKGTQAFFNATNDSWYGHPFEPNQHLYMTLARAIEFRRPIMRATNTGITTGILADGTILEKSPQDQEWAGLFNLSYWTNPPMTFYQLFGVYYLYLGLLVLGALVILGRTKKNAT